MRRKAWPQQGQTGLALDSDGMVLALGRSCRTQYRHATLGVD
jgi:hypothetical protein